MKNIFLPIVATIMTISSLQAQNDSLYIMRSGSVIGKYKTTEIDSVIFHHPAGGSTILYAALYNNWEVKSGMPNTKFITIKSDNSYSIFNEDKTWGFRSIGNDMSFISGTQLSLVNNGYFMYSYNYSVKNDSLILSNANEKIIAIKNNNAPKKTQWIDYVSSLDSVPFPIQFGDPREDIGFDGQNIILTGDANSRTLYKINVNTKTVSTLALKYNAYYSSASFANNSIWFLSTNNVSKIDMNGSTTFSSAQLNNGDRTDGGGFAFDGTNFYCSSRNCIYNYNITNNSWTNLYDIQNVTGMEYVGGYLYVVKEGAIHKCTISPFRVVKTYIINSATDSGGYGRLIGITYDGTYFWISLYNKHSNKKEIHKVNLN